MVALQDAWSRLANLIFVHGMFISASMPDDVLATAMMPGQLLARGVGRHLRSHDFVSVEELVPTSGLRVDVMALGPKGEIWIVECKSSRADFQADHKWQGYLAWCDRFFWAVDTDFPTELLPADTINPNHALIRRPNLKICRDIAFVVDPHAPLRFGYAGVAWNDATWQGRRRRAVFAGVYPRHRAKVVVVMQGPWRKRCVKFSCSTRAL